MISFDRDLRVGDDVFLRRWHSTDAASLAVAFSDPEITRWLWSGPYSTMDAQHYLSLADNAWRQGAAYELAIVNTQGEILGAIEIAFGGASISYWLCRNARGRGIVTRSLRVFMAWASATFKVADFYIEAEAANTASCAVALRAGFIEQGKLGKTTGWRTFWHPA